MASTLNGLLSMGTSALAASQACINTTGNNISNVNTVGYSRQSVWLTERTAISSYAGEIGQGVQAQEVMRSYDRYIMSSLVKQMGASARYEAANSIISSVESVFNESTVSGISGGLSSLFSSWNDLAQEPSSLAVREALLASSQTLVSTIKAADSTLADLQNELEALIQADVTKANQLLQEIADLNRQINTLSVSGSNNPNSLLDERDQKVRELAVIMDINIQDKGAGNYNITTSAGYNLVQADVAFSLTYEGPRAENNLTAGSPYKNSGGSGTIGFSGTDSKEYLVQVVDGGAVDGGATFKVSLDGGKTWLSNDDGSVRLFDANSEGNSVKAGELELWFDFGESLAAGDKFVISPKNDVYWVTTTSDILNVSPQSYGGSAENPLRLSGGSLAGYLTVRDQMIGEYRDRLDALAESVIWEVNRVHSQGTGLNTLIYALGETRVGNTGVPLGGDTAGLNWSDRLSAGNISFCVYDATTGASLIPYPGLEVFSGTNFDPETMSLEDVRDMINAASFTDADGNTVTPFSASIVDNKLQIATTSPDYTFAVTSDTTGLLAALGINTFFTGEGASTIALRSDVANDPNLVNAGRVNGAGEVNDGDNSTAQAISALAEKTVTILSAGGSVRQSLTDYYATLVTKVGGDTASVKNTASREGTVTAFLESRHDEVAGVSLDEELSNLIRFQSSYKAAAKLITTADEMFQTVLGLKQ